MGSKVRNKNIKIAVLILFLIICGLAVYCILFWPLPRQIGLTFRNTLYVFPLVFLAAWACCAIHNTFFRMILSCVLFAFVLLPYSGLLNSGLSDQYALGGVIPWSDAFTMQLNTQRFLYGGLMGQSTAIRPLSTIFYAVFLHFTDNNYLALQVFLCVIIALCLISAMLAVSKSTGSVCGAFFFTILYFYIRQRIGTYMTEPYGFICGLISCYWFFNGIRTRNPIAMLPGFLFLSIGLNARPAAMFMLPAVGLWYFFVFLQDHPKKFFYSAIALVMLLSGFVVNRMSQIAVYGNKTIPNRQAAEMVYGLCLGGKAWGEVTAAPVMTALNNSDNILRDVAKLCMPVLKEHPENILSALRTIFVDSLINSEYYGAFSYVNGNPGMLRVPVRYGLMILWLMGFIGLIIKRKNLVNSFLLFSSVGIIISECAAVPFSTNYLRLYAVSMWVPACIVGITPQYIFNRLRTSTFPSEESDIFSRPISFIAGTLIILCAIFGSSYIKTHPLSRPQQLDEICGNDEEILITSVDRGSFIYLSEQPELKIEHYPYFRLPYVRQHIHDTASVEMFPFTDAIDKPTAVIRGIDLGNLEDALIFSPLEMVDGKTGYVQFCGHFIDPPILRNDRFFIPSSAYFYKDNL